MPTVLTRPPRLREFNEAAVWNAAAFWKLTWPITLATVHGRRTKEQ